MISPLNPHNNILIKKPYPIEIPIGIRDPRSFSYEVSPGLLSGLYKGFLANVVRSVGGALVLVWGTQLRDGADAGGEWLVNGD